MVKIIFLNLTIFIDFQRNLLTQPPSIRLMITITINKTWIQSTILALPSHARHVFVVHNDMIDISSILEYIFCSCLTHVVSIGFDWRAQVDDYNYN